MNTEDNIEKFESPILTWKKKGVLIWEKGNSGNYNKTLFIYYPSITCVRYREDKHLLDKDEIDPDDPTYTHYTTSTIVLQLVNNLILELNYYEEAPYIYEYFQNHSDGYLNLIH